MSPRLLALAAPLALALAGAGLVLAAGPPAQADQRVAPVTDATVRKECGACHMAYPAAFLPKRSWEALMGGLKSHFGENAELDAATTAAIGAYLAANAADAREARPRVLRGLAPGETPLRISDLPWWKREHEGEVRPEAFTAPKVGSKANCIACHRDAERGSYDD